jgi:hypothetical protein
MSLARSGNDSTVVASGSIFEGLQEVMSKANTNVVVKNFIDF